MVNQDLLQALSSLDLESEEMCSKIVDSWCNSNGHCFSSFINGIFISDHVKTIPIVDPSTSKKIADVKFCDEGTIIPALKASSDAPSAWNTDEFVRSRVLRKLADQVEKDKKLLSLLQAMVVGGNIKYIEDFDIPNAICTIIFFSDICLTVDSKFPNWSPIGTVEIILPDFCSLTSMFVQLIPVIAAGNKVLVQGSRFTALQLTWLCQAFQSIELPKAVFNVMYRDPDSVPLNLMSFKPGNDFRGISYRGSLRHARDLRMCASRQGLSLHIGCKGNNPVIVFESADLDSACEAIIQSMSSVEFCHSRLLVQESILKQLTDKLKERAMKVKVGNPLDRNADLGPLPSYDYAKKLQKVIELAYTEGGDVFIASEHRENFVYPVIISNVQTVSDVYQEGTGGPVVTITPFRTVKEAIAMANNSLYGSAAFIFSENCAQSLEVSHMLNFQFVCINMCGYFNPAGVGTGFEQSGNWGRSGADLLLPFMQSEHRQMETFPCIPVTVKVDLSKSVSAASAAQKAWMKLSIMDRNLKLYKMIQTIESQQEAIVAEYTRITEIDSLKAKQELDLSIKRLYYWIATANQLEERVQFPSNGELTIAVEEPLGVIAVIPPDSNQLSAFCTLVGCAVSCGNSVIIPGCPNVPFAVVDAFSTLPIFKVLAGEKEKLAAELSGSDDIQAIWYFGSAEGAKMVECRSTVDMKHVWTNPEKAYDWIEDKRIQKNEFFIHALRKKNICFPIGDIFSN